MTRVVFTYVAVKPIRAEHPVGSGSIVTYEPGDVVPANEWGRATDNLVELGKLARLAFNVEDEIGGGSNGPAPVEPDLEPALDVTQASYPLEGKAGWWTLSNGEHVRGQDAAYAAEAELGG